MVYIYGLYVNNINDIRYVGKTNNIEKRLYEHIKDSLRNNKTHKHKWINKQLNNNKEINIKILEKCDKNDWVKKEKYWINYYNNLTNHTEGGEGGHGKLYYITYSDAKKIVHKLNIKSKTDWYNYIKNNSIDNLPNHPRQYFLDNGWKGWGDFLGTNRTQDNLKSKNYISYKDAKEWIKYNIKPYTIEDWKKLVKNNIIPNYIPNRPDRFYSYKDRGWVNWGDFLGTNKIANQNKKFISYDDAKKIVHELKIKSIKHWNLIYNDKLKKYNIPSLPCSTYKDRGWVNWGDFLGTNRKQDNLLTLNYVNYEDAKIWVENNLNIKSRKEWIENVNNNKIPIEIPNHPENYYYKKNRGWKGWKDFLNKRK